MAIFEPLDYLIGQNLMGQSRYSVGGKPSIGFNLSLCLIISLSLFVSLTPEFNAEV